MADVYEVGDIVKMKKKHPCGSFEWEILRVGADFRLKCVGCGHQIMIARKIVKKNTKELKQIIKNGNYDVVHCHQDYKSLIAVIIAKATVTILVMKFIFSLSFFASSPSLGNTTPRS